MIIVLQAAGTAAVLIGLAAIGYGIPVKEFSFGNTLIVAGTVGLCTGLILLGLSVVAWELRGLARRLTSSARPAPEPRARAALPPFPASAAAGAAAGDGGPSFTRDQPPPTVPPETPAAAPVAPPWHEDSTARAPLESSEAAHAEPSAKPRRNLLFSSTVRKDRERSPAAEPGEVPTASFEDAWPKPDRGRPAEMPQRRMSRLSPTSAESAAGASAERAAPVRTEEPAVTVVKSGVVDGMAYSLYSDGSIEAQMPEGMMRFASIDELRAHLEQRP